MIEFDLDPKHVFDVHFSVDCVHFLKMSKIASKENLVDQLGAFEDQSRKLRHEFCNQLERTQTYTLNLFLAYMKCTWYTF